MLLNKYELRRIPPSVNKNTKLELELPSASYFCYVPQISVYTEEELAMYGVRNEGYVDDLQEGNLNKLILVKWRLTDMLNAYISGYRIMLEKKSDVIKLTEEIDEYFEKVNNILDVGDGSRYEFDDRLEALDSFNRSIYNNNFGVISARREEIIRKASLQDMAPSVLLQEINHISNIQPTYDANGNEQVINKYNSRNTNVTTPLVNTTNPLAPIYAQEPVIEFNRNYSPRFRDPMERKLELEYMRAKQQLENKE